MDDSWSSAKGGRRGAKMERVQRYEERNQRDEERGLRSSARRDLWIGYNLIYECEWEW